MNIDEFHRLLGETIMHCQIIEHDVKLIYALMANGDLEENLQVVKTWTLGKAVKKLRVLDCSDNEPYIDISDYKFLNKMTKKRNFLCRGIYQKFLYDENNMEKKFKKEFNKLNKYLAEFAAVAEVLEKVRLQVAKDFRGID